MKIKFFSVGTLNLHVFFLPPIFMQLGCYKKMKNKDITAPITP